MTAHMMLIQMLQNQLGSNTVEQITGFLVVLGKLVKKDFNIAEEAGGVGKAITKGFPTIVTNTTLEIRLYWAGKGTTSLPYRSVYGPLISAISARLLKKEGNLMELVDKRLGSDFNKEEVMVMINVALLCTNVTQTLRPAMSSVVSMLEGRSVVHEVVSESRDVFDEKMEAMRLHYTEIQEHSTISREGPSPASTISTAHLYPVHYGSSYLERRN
ncbi:unnamed protein product [Lupinus luteus]|uniref:non-specific serine/threonine protein kinase n=1 Tax=Lupinus luteus TaxID=3873 RepID=A0AAV1WN38_LUPLU